MFVVLGGAKVRFFVGFFHGVWKNATVGEEGGAGDGVACQAVAVRGTGLAGEGACILLIR